MKTLLFALWLVVPSTLAIQAQTADQETRAPLVFTGGHETDPQDRGRPVILIASALNVPAEVFRAAFRNVKPASAGQEPQPGQVRLNKAALMTALSPYGVTDDRLNTVSNYYRYNRSRGEMWPTTPATGYATVRQGVVVSVTITDPGSGYSSPPSVSITGIPDVHPVAKLTFSTDFAQNGSIKEVSLAGAASLHP